MHDHGHRWGNAPSLQTIEQAAFFIIVLSMELNNARLHGFIDQVVQRQRQTTELS